MSSSTCPRCGTALEPERFDTCPVCLLTAELPSIELGRELELVEEIGRGGMGTVYRARDLTLGREVAVKLIAEELSAGPEFRARFEREARALAALDHPNIVAVHRYGRDGERAWLVMPLIEGGTLADHLPLERERALELAAQLADALDYAHARGVVHRDLKPQNVLIDADGRARLTDFGLAGLVEPGDARLTRAGLALGTPAYMAPEAHAGAPPEPRMDVYSLGALLYEMLTGRPPLGVFEPLEPGLDAVVRRSLQSDPARRYASAAELRDALRSLLGRPAPPTRARVLPEEEVLWMRAMALAATIATAAALFAVFAASVPMRIEPGGDTPLVMIARSLDDGSRVAYAHFEVVPALVALATCALAAALFGALHRHWRIAGLFEREPALPLPRARTVLWLGAASCALYLVRLALERTGSDLVVGYIPILGATLELAVLYVGWLVVLEAWRVARPLRREGRLWLGLGLALLPPVIEYARFVASWEP